MDFIIFSLAVYRVSILIVSEDGPLDIVLLFRKFFRKIPKLGVLVDCEYCVSMWASMAIFLYLEPKEAILWWLGGSGAACLVFYIKETFSPLNVEFEDDA